MNAKKPLTGYHVFAMVAAFFLVIITVNFTMAWLALDSWTGLVVKNSYVASQEYNARISAAKIQSSRGWRMGISFSDSIVVITLKDRENQPVFLSNLVIKVGRPVSETSDVEVALVHQGNGIYQSHLELARGVWAYELNSDGDNPYHIEGRMLVSASGVGTTQ